MTVENGKVVIHAVHEKDAEKFWEKLKLKEVEKCVICGVDVTYKTVGAFLPIKGKVRVICEKLLCFSELVRLKNSSLKILEKEVKVWFG